MVNEFGGARTMLGRSEPRYLKTHGGRTADEPLRRATLPERYRKLRLRAGAAQRDDAEICQLAETLPENAAVAHNAAVTTARTAPHAPPRKPAPASCN